VWANSESHSPDGHFVQIAFRDGFRNSYLALNRTIIILVYSFMFISCKLFTFDLMQ
jgi:hypothetical protein